MRSSRIMCVEDNGPADVGKLGEYNFAAVQSASAIALTTDVETNLTSIVLPPGDWDVMSAVCFGTLAGTTSITRVASSMSIVSATINTAAGLFAQHRNAAEVPGVISNFVRALALPPFRFAFSSATTVYLVVVASFTVAGLNAHGRLSVRRPR